MEAKITSGFQFNPSSRDFTGESWYGPAGMATVVDRDMRSGSWHVDRGDWSQLIRPHIVEGALDGEKATREYVTLILAGDHHLSIPVTARDLSDAFEAGRRVARAMYPDTEPKQLSGWEA